MSVEKEMTFKVNEKEMETFHKWADSLPKPRSNTPSYYFKFIPGGGIGYSLYAGRTDGHEINITDYDTW